MITLTRTLGVATRSGEPATFTAVFDLKTETLVSYSASPALLETVQMTTTELDNHLRREMGPVYNLEPDIQNSYSHSDCIRGCYNDYEKGQGRGRCKFNCWVDTVMEFIKALVPIFERS